MELEEGRGRHGTEQRKKICAGTERRQDESREIEQRKENCAGTKDTERRNEERKDKEKLC